MTTGYILLLAIGLLVVLGILRESWQSGRLFCAPLPRPYRNRDSQQDEWRGRYGEDADEVDAVLTIVCDAFLFNPDDRYKLKPDDRIMGIYEAVYPRWKVWLATDSMEIETLAMNLDENFGIETSEWHPEITVSEIIALAAERRLNGEESKLD